MTKINIGSSISNIPLTELKRAFKATKLQYNTDASKRINFEYFVLSESESKTDKHIDILIKRFAAYIVYDAVSELIQQPKPAPIQKRLL